MTKKNTHKENLNMIQQIVDMVNKDNLLELEYEADDFKVKVVKNLKNSFSIPQETVTSIPDIRENKDVSKSIEKVEQFTNKHPGAVNSPMVGTFYASASPGAKPFVSVGDIVAEGDVVCIVEAMKMMNEIKSEFSGKVLSINVENAEPVEYGQLLFELSK